MFVDRIPLTAYVLIALYEIKDVSGVSWFFFCFFVRLLYFFVSQGGTIVV
jgi:hypothetical protein